MIRSLINGLNISHFNLGIILDIAIEFCESTQEIVRLKTAQIVIGETNMPYLTFHKLLVDLSHLQMSS